jgi:glycosyltransferase involved in cell wall biosynthesis
MMKSNSPKVALVTESLWRMAGANKVLESFAEIYPDSDIYALFGDRKYLSEKLQKHNIYFSFLNRIPFIKSLYRYTFHLWPIAVESFNFSEYALVISNSSSVAHGVITPLGCKHVVYINSPMRYTWDLNFLYIKIVRFGFLKRCIKDVLVSFNRMWDVVSAQRAGVLIANSNFVAKRIKKYWGRDVDYVIHPPVSLFKNKIVSKRKNYYVAGAPFEPNKRGDFLLECASKMGFNLKLIGAGSMKKKLERKYRRYKNIEFLDWITDEEKYELIANSKGLIVPGIEDYGIFCAEAISCGTPVLAYGKGGSLEIVKERKNGLFFFKWEYRDFKKAFTDFNKIDWNYERVRRSLFSVNTESSFKEKVKKVLVE